MRTKTGTVVSDKMDKTIVVLVEYAKVHPIYKKAYKMSQKFKAHDPENKFKAGDAVTIYEAGKRFSKTKAWTTVAPDSSKKTSKKVTT